MIFKRKQKKQIEEEQKKPVEKKLKKPIEEVLNEPIEEEQSKPKEKKKNKNWGLIITIIGIIVTILVPMYIFFQTREPDFIILVNPMQDTVFIGNTVQTRITVKGIKGYNNSVGLGASGQSSGLKITFNPQLAVTDPEFNSEMMIYVDTHTSEGADTIVIQGTGADGKEHSCKYFLKIDSRPLLQPRQFYMVYSDMGIAEGDIWIWSGADWGFGPPKVINAKDTSMNAPEGKECFTVEGGSGGGNYIGWGVFLGNFNSKHELTRPHTVDLSRYDSLIFWVKTSVDLKVEIQQDNNNGAKSDPCFISNFGWKSSVPDAWQRIAIPKKTFKYVNLKKIFGPFLITGKGSSITFSIDDVKWVAR